MFLRKSKRALVLGCGPAGLFAAHALHMSGWEFDIVSNKRRSEMFGAQYLHLPIPGLDGHDDPTNLNYTLEGTVDGYRTKVYGEAEVQSVSPMRFSGRHAVWDIRRAYFDAWDRYHGRVDHEPGLDGDWLQALPWRDRYRMVISTIPRPSLCLGGHQFRYGEIWAIGDAPERGIFAPYAAPVNTVQCDGTRDRGWYRASNIFGYKTVEWPIRTKPIHGEAARVQKPINHNCVCHQDSKQRIVFLGRYGAWDKLQLSHSAYYDLKAVLS